MASWVLNELVSVLSDWVERESEWVTEWVSEWREKVKELLSEWVGRESEWITAEWERNEWVRELVVVYQQCDKSVQSSNMGPNIKYQHWKIAILLNCDSTILMMGFFMHLFQT